MTPMPEPGRVLTREQVEEGRLARDYVTAYSRLARSHEQLRTENERLTDRLQEVEHPFDASEFKTLHDRALRAETGLAAAQEALKDLLDDMDVVFEDDRLKYLEVWITGSVLQDARAALARGGGQGNKRGAPEEAPQPTEEEG